MVVCRIRARSRNIRSESSVWTELAWGPVVIEGLDKLSQVPGGSEMLMSRVLDLDAGAGGSITCLGLIMTLRGDWFLQMVKFSPDSWSQW